MGLKLRGRLIPALVRHQADGPMMMITLTIDPQHFDYDPEKAYRYCRDKAGLMGRFHRHLRKRVKLANCHYFWVLEFQRNGMPHWHMLLFADRVEHEAIQDAWNQFCPVPVKEARVGFGAVKFSKLQFASAEHAGNYACKYLIQKPKNGYPDWVLDYEGGQIQLFNVSKGFWSTVEDTEIATGQTETAEETKVERKKACTQGTIRERLARCKKAACVFELIEDDKGEVTGRRWLGGCFWTFDEMRRIYGNGVSPKADAFEVERALVANVLRSIDFDGTMASDAICPEPEPVFEWQETFEEDDAGTLCEAYDACDWETSERVF